MGTNVSPGLEAHLASIIQFRGGQGLTLVTFSAQPEPFLIQNATSTYPAAPRHLPNNPKTTAKFTPHPTESAYVEPKSGRV